MIQQIWIWGVGGATIDTPIVENLDDFIARKQNNEPNFIMKTKDNAQNYLHWYKNNVSPKMNYFVGLPLEFEHFRKTLPIITKGDNGSLADDISVFHDSFMESLDRAIDTMGLTDKMRFELIFKIIIKYNLDLAIKDFNPNFTIPSRDKGVLATGLKEVKKYDNDIYSKLAIISGLEHDALPNNIIDAYEYNLSILHNQNTKP